MNAAEQSKELKVDGVVWSGGHFNPIPIECLAIFSRGVQETHRLYLPHFESPPLRPDPRPTHSAPHAPLSTPLVADPRCPAPTLGNTVMIGDLTPKQRRFVEEYIVDLNGTAAARRANLDTVWPRQIASELLAKPDIQAAVAAAIEARSQRTRITADQVLREYAKLGLSDIRRAVDWGGAVAVRDAESGEERIMSGVAMRSSDEIDQDTAAAIAEVSQAKDGTLKIKLHDKKGALDSMARHLGMFTDKLEHVFPQMDPETRRKRIAALEAVLAAENAETG